MKVSALSFFMASLCAVSSSSLPPKEAPNMNKPEDQMEQGDDSEERKLSSYYYGGGGGYPYYGGGGGGYQSYYYGAYYPYYTSYYGSYYSYPYYNWHGGGHGFPFPPTPPIAVPGRPFRTELDGPALSAEVAVGTDGESARVWSRFPHDPRELSLSPLGEDKEGSPRPADQEAVAEWATRASGEHASIASFAVFTLQLMANAAPPHLIREALGAALDELQHAEVSFGMAALFAADPQAVVEPGALPAVDNLKLERDLKALALGVAKEGCIDESLSALELASDARALLSLENKNDKLNEIAGKATWKIAVDESRHSMLSWRTMEWICHQDVSLCEEISDTILNPSSMAEAYDRRFPDRKDMKDAWQEMSAALTKAVLHRNVDTNRVDCVIRPENVLKVEHGAGALAGHITRSILCPMVMAAETSATD